VRVSIDVSVKVIDAGKDGTGNSNPNALFCTTLVGGEGPLSRLGYFTPEKNPPVPTDYLARKATGSDLTRHKREKSLCPAGDQITIRQLSGRFLSPYTNRTI
jgi:hypothetical protein